MVRLAVSLSLAVTPHQMLAENANVDANHFHTKMVNLDSLI